MHHTRSKIIFRSKGETILEFELSFGTVIGIKTVLTTYITHDEVIAHACCAILAMCIRAVYLAMACLVQYMTYIMHAACMMGNVLTTT
jgi:uncharacterized protein (UPF0333 family)